MLLVMALIVIYILLGVLYESYIHPLTILAGLPSAAVGALITLHLFDVELTLIATIGILMLIGIVKKNAIMMLDFAIEAERAAAGVLLAASLTIGFVPSLVTKSVNPVAAGVTTYSQHNTKAPAKAAPAKAAQPAQR